MTHRIAKPIADHLYHSKSDDELRFIARDAQAAAKAIQGHDYRAECKYLDQVNDACTVLHYRTRLAFPQAFEGGRE